ncbi:MAG: Beta-galactosidase C-terminal domain, partial [Clostridium sp.]
LELRRAIDVELPLGVNAEMREDGVNKYVFLMNFSEEEKKVTLDKEYFEMLSNSPVSGEVVLEKYKVMVLKTTV